MTTFVPFRPDERQQLDPAAGLTAGSTLQPNAYTLAFGGLLLLCGRLGDLHGRRRLFVLGLLVFAVGSVLAAAAEYPTVLIAGRALQGTGPPRSCRPRCPCSPPRSPGAGRAAGRWPPTARWPRSASWSGWWAAE